MDLTLLNYPIFLGVLIALYALLTLGLNIQWGFAGLFNAGVAGFFAVGAYTSALLTAPPDPERILGLELPVAVGWLAATVMAALIAWPIGKVTLRFRADYLAIATIGIAEIIRLILRSEEALSGGVRGITQIPRPFGDLPYEAAQLAYLLLSWSLVGIIYWALERQVRAPWGRMMRAIRDNEAAAAAMGKDVEARRLEAFILGAAIMGLAGALYVHFMRAITPEAIDPMMVTFLVWIMLILGGSGNNRGALLGTALIWLIWSASELLTDRLPAEYATQAKYVRLFAVGLLLQIVLRWRPAGLLPERLYSIGQKG
ncbi:MAG: branched-chain amino acid ABC transporter permease [Hydrogenophilus sp.]|nr:branched-chain amino acid ABC transporter permease [Hydrogenophilus sp.]